jgi:hypothetical protein
MPRTFVIVLILAALGLLSPRKVAAGPPEGASGKMVFDQVADGLRTFRKEKHTGRGWRLINRLAATGDPRVAVALGEAWEDKMEEGRLAVAGLILQYYCPTQRLPAFSLGGELVDDWWVKNKADLRRRAAQLPR